MPKSATNTIEEMLIPEYPKPELVSGYDILGTGDDTIYMDEFGNYQAPEKVSKVFTGPEALKFLGLNPNQKFGVLKEGDHKRIYQHFKNLLVTWAKDGKDLNELFWNNLTIKVWKKSNVGKMTPAVKGKGYSCESTLYQGDVFKGSALESFLPNADKNGRFSSERYREYKVQLLEVRATEEMLNEIY